MGLHATVPSDVRPTAADRRSQNAYARRQVRYEKAGRLNEPPRTGRHSYKFLTGARWIDDDAIGDPTVIHRRL
jgi:hypothetical protein